MHSPGTQPELLRQPKADIRAAKVMSALPLKADMCSARAHVRYGPEADIGQITTADCDVRFTPNSGIEGLFGTVTSGFFVDLKQFASRRLQGQQTLPPQ